jgi:hypothetical protein
MINTVNIKQQQLKNGYYKTGSGPEHIFIMGSCRVVNYVNYFAAMPQFTVYSIDPFNWNWDKDDNRVDYEQALKAMEGHYGLLEMFKSSTIFIHEYYENAGMFNIKNIYDYGLNPTIDICIPNFNDLFILFKDIITFDSEMRKLAAQDFNVIGRLSEQTETEIMTIRNKNIIKFMHVCSLSDLPDMAQYFTDNFLNIRLFWSYNHVTKDFTLAVFDLINSKYFNNHLTVDRQHEDIFANNYTFLTEYDAAFKWPEQIKKLSL